MKNLQKTEVLLVFTYAPAGLGHLRVTDALCDGLPKGVSSILLGADDTKITYWHRLMSVSPIIRELMEWLQQKKNGYWFYTLYIWTLKVTAGNLYLQMKSLIKSQLWEKKTVVVVSTHFGLAHQISTIKSRLEKDFNIRLVLVVQVTDATSIEIWYVPGADLISVPSKKVKAELLKYARERGLKKTEIVVLPYPLSQTLGRKLNEEEYNLRLKQYNKDSSTKIKVVIPISGAAVGLAYYDKLITKLKKSNNRIMVYLVVRNNIYTKAFIDRMKTRDYVTVIESSLDKKVVDSYEKLYRDEVIALEIVKPSEQAFKTLFLPDQRGGSILLLTEAIGKQEHDNLNFLLDHKLLPNREDQEKLLKYALENKLPDEKDCLECRRRALRWKAIRLTNDPDCDVAIINWCIRVGIFEIMSRQREHLMLRDPELASNGVQQFWQKVDAVVEQEK